MVSAVASLARRNVVNHRQIEELAAAWLVRRGSGEWTAEDEEQLTGWLREATAHRVAFLRLEVACEESQRLKAFAAGVEPGVVPPPGEWRQSPFFENGAAPAEAVDATAANAGLWRLPRRWVQRNWAVVAACLLVLAVGTGFWLLRPGERGEQYTTQLGGVESVPLRDGSAVTLNTASRIRVELKSGERHIELQQGEAFFSVARDPKRPFVVAVGDRRVVAVGTQFAVRREAGEIRVVVAEGTVTLEGDGQVRLRAGAVARTRGPDVLVRNEPLDNVQALLGWREGFLIFRDTTLGEAIAEFNRYNSRHIEIGDPTVADIRVSGAFRPTHYEAFVRLLHEGYSIRAETRGNELILTRH